MGAVMDQTAKPVTLVSQSKYARSRGISQQAVSKAIRSGRITTIGGKIDPVVADAAWTSNTRPRVDLHVPSTTPSLAPPPADGADPGTGHDEAASDRPLATFSAARALREIYLAKRAKLDFERAEGKLVRTEEVDALAFNAARKIRDQLLALPARLAPVIFAARDQAECYRILEDALRQVCSGISPETITAKRPPSGRSRRRRK
jgi:hypothetical protein